MADWTKTLQPSGVTFMNDIVQQMPEGLARQGFEMMLNKIAEGEPEMQHKVAKLEALEAAGVDNWDGYDDALEDAGLDGQGVPLGDEDDDD